MGEQNMDNMGGVTDEEADLDRGFSQSNWDSKFEVGQIFSTKEALFSKLRLMALKGHFEFKVDRSSKKILAAVCCQSPCPWRVRASIYGERNFIIVKYISGHQYDLRLINDNHRQVSAKLMRNAVK